MKFLKALTVPTLMLLVSSGVANTKSLQNTMEWCPYPMNMNAELDDHLAIQVKSSSKSNYSSGDRSEYRERFRSRFPKQIVPQGKRVFFFSPRLKSWAAYDEAGRRIGYGRANGGSHWCADLGRPCRTPRGEFRVRSKGAPSCKSRKFPLPKGGAPMPYCMFFLGGYAIHGSPGISNVNSSHGCIRVYTAAAHWLSNYFIRIGTRIVVLSY